MDSGFFVRCLMTPLKADEVVCVQDHAVGFCYSMLMPVMFSKCSQIGLLKVEWYFGPVFLVPHSVIEFVGIDLCSLVMQKPLDKMLVDTAQKATIHQVTPPC